MARSQALSRSSGLQPKGRLAAPLFAIMKLPTRRLISGTTASDTDYVTAVMLIRGGIPRSNVRFLRRRVGFRRGAFSASANQSLEGCTQGFPRPR
jgi:hypothetical protein